MIVDDSLVPVLAKLAPELSTVEQYIVVGDADTAALEGNRAEVLRYEELLAAEQPGFDLPRDRRTRRGRDVLHERDHRPPQGGRLLAPVHVPALAGCAPERGDRLHRARPRAPGRADVPRQRVGHPLRRVDGRRRTWSCPTGSCRPSRSLASSTQERPTCAGAVPTIWTDLLNYADSHPVELSSLRRVLCGGSAVPRSLIEQFDERFGVQILQGWGMTETSPLAAVVIAAESRRTRHGRGDGLAGQVRARRSRVSSCASSATTAPRCRGTARRSARSRCAGRGSPARTTRIPTPRSSTTAGCAPATSRSVTPNGYVQITDRAKDVIKSGGEWISSVELEDHLMAHPDVIEAAVIAVPDEKW